MVMNRDLIGGDEHTMQRTDDVLYNCVPETNCVNQYHTNKFHKKEKKETMGSESHCFSQKIYYRTQMSMARVSFLVFPGTQSQTEGHAL